MLKAAALNALGAQQSALFDPNSATPLYTTPDGEFGAVATGDLSGLSVSAEAPSLSYRSTIGVFSDDVQAAALQGLAFSNAASGAASEEGGAAALRGTAGVGGGGAFLGRFFQLRSTVLFCAGVIVDARTLYDAHQNGRTFSEEVEHRQQASPIGPLPGMPNPFYDERRAMMYQPG
jgi:hypothetical protein